MKITESKLRRIIRESIADEFRAQLLARKKHYDDLAAQPLPYEEGDLISVRGERWTGVFKGTPVVIEPGTDLDVLAINSTTSGDFTPTEPITLQVPEIAVRMLRLESDTIDVEPGDVIRISGAQIRNVRRLVRGGHK